MASRAKPSRRLQCAHEGCGEVSLWTFDNRAEQTRHFQRVTEWRCARHSKPDEVLSLERRIIQFTCPPSETGYTEVGFDRRRVATGVYWGNTGFLSGPGFRAWTDDFPVGTRIRVTAEVILPVSIDDPPFGSPEVAG